MRPDADADVDATAADDDARLLGVACTPCVYVAAPIVVVVAVAGRTLLGGSVTTGAVATGRFKCGIAKTPPPPDLESVDATLDAENGRGGGGIFTGAGNAERCVILSACARVGACLRAFFFSSCLYTLQRHLLGFINTPIHQICNINLIIKLIIIKYYYFSLSFSMLRALFYL